MTKKLALLALSAAMAALSAGCFRQDVLTLTVKVPGMKSAACAKVITDALSRVDGVVSAQPDTAERTIAVTYDSKKLAIVNIEFLIAGVGFDANNVPAKPDARQALPAECR